MAISLWWLRWWSLVHVSLHVGHCGRHVDQQLRLCGEELLHPYRWWWWWCLAIVLTINVVGVGVAVAASSLTLHCWLINS
jgi:hypothetical protein